EIAALGLEGAAAGMGALSSFDHRDYGLDLNPAMILGLVESRLHQPSITSTGWLVGRAPVLGRNQRPHAASLAGKAMIGFGVVARVGREALEEHRTQCIAQERHQLVDVWTRTATDADGEDEVAAGVA